jgi:Trk-type K+ transport system membrane component
VGLSAGIVGPEAPPTVLVALMAAMVVGRLEFLVVLAALAKIASDLRRALRR